MKLLFEWRLAKRREVPQILCEEGSIKREIKKKIKKISRGGERGREGEDKAEGSENAKINKDEENLSGDKQGEEKLE